MIDPYTEVQRFTYKPGWSFSVYDPRDAFASDLTVVGPMDEFPYVLLVTAELPDSRGEGTITTSYNYPIPAANLEDENVFAQVLRDAVRNFEFHELSEWIRRDGKIVFNPHKDKGHYIPGAYSVMRGHGDPATADQPDA